MAESEEVDGRRLWEKTKDVVKQRIGDHWPALARACGIEDTQIDGIRHGQQYNMPEQVYQMFNKISMQRSHCTAHSLMQCLRVAAIKSTDNRLRGLAEHVFNMIIDDVCTDLFFDKWEKIAHSAGFSTEEVHQLMSGNPSDKKEQGRAFLHKWSQKSGWDMLKELPFALENMDKGKTANRVVQDVFGMSCLDALKSAIKPRQTYRELDIGDVVEVEYRGIRCEGVLKWCGYLLNLSEDIKMAGIELLYDYSTLSGHKCNGMYQGQRYFTCDEQMGLFVLLQDVKFNNKFSESNDSSSVLNLDLNDNPPQIGTCRKQPPDLPLSEGNHHVTSSLPANPSHLPTSHDILSRSTSTPSSTPLPRGRHPGAKSTSSLPPGDLVSDLCSPHRYHFPPDTTGLLIGKNGRNIKQVENDTGTRITVKPGPLPGSPTAVSIYGTLKQSEVAAAKMTDLIKSATEALIRSSP
jgi:hypothetical protein